MAELYLIRHGQASFGSDDYDQLSELGYQQCRWLGEYFQARGIEFDRIICGEMARHRQSADSICQGLGVTQTYETHSGFNEFDFKQLLLGYGSANSGPAKIDWGNPREVYRCLRQSMLAWSSGHLPADAVPESWQAFQQRVSDALDFARREAVGKTLICSSGGAISMALSQLMGFGAQTLVDINLQMRNSAITHCFYKPEIAYVTGFNSVPHLDTPERLNSVTYS